MPSGASGGTFYVIFTAEITPQTIEPLIQALSNLAQQGAAEVYLAFSTPGGSVAAGITLYNFMRGLPYKLVAHNIGNVDSIGNAVFLAADERYACPHSTFMFHGVGFDNPARRYEWKDLDQMMDSLMADEKRIADIICERSDVSEDEAKDFFMLQQTKSAEFARERGVIHEIRDLSLPLGAPVLSLVFQR